MTTMRRLAWLIVAVSAISIVVNIAAIYNMTDHTEHARAARDGARDRTDQEYRP